MENKTLLDALEIRFDSDAGKNITIRHYLFSLISVLWKEQECFSGKRPFGNSGWDYDLYVPLIKNGFLAGEIDEDGYIENIDDKAAHEYVSRLIHAAFYGLEQERKP